MSIGVFTGADYDEIACTFVCRGDNGRIWTTIEDIAVIEIHRSIACERSESSQVRPGMRNCLIGVTASLLQNAIGSQ